MKLTIISEVPRYPVPRELIEKVLKRAYKRRAKGKLTVNLLLLTDRAIAKLNRDHAAHKGATDVLAFSSNEEDPQAGVVHLGDIAISVDTARKVAKKKNLRICDEVTLYALHGLLHLLGMRDDTKKAREEMIEAQREEFVAHNLHFDLD